MNGFADENCRVFNTGSPYNVPAGHRARNIGELVAHYEKLNAEEEEKKLNDLEERKKK